MGKNNNIIEINGKRYDANTGVVLDVFAPHMKTVTTATRPAPRPVAKSMDIHPPTAAKHTPMHHTRVPNHAARKVAKKAAAHKPEEARTLMRTVVKKPEATFKHRLKAQSSADSQLASKAVLVPKRSIGSLDPKRAAHAKRVAKSGAIQRFNHSAVAPHSPHSPHTVPSHSSLPPRPAEPKPPHHAAPAPKKDPASDLLERAIQQATSHLEQPPAETSRRFSRKSSAFAIVAAVVIIAGFVAFQNINTVRMKVASAKAGFSANLPGYKPAGYHLSQLQSAPGQVSLNFKSNSDGRAYNIIEKDSNWNNDALLDNVVSSSGQDYDTVELAGQTLYVYANHMATWVNGGVWYQVKTDGSLSTRQLVDLATSM